MSTHPSIVEPFLLSSYGFLPPKDRTQSNSLYATYVEKPKSKGSSYVTVAAPADGVHVLDASALHPIISHTLGPSTVFAAPALTTVSSSSSVFTTYAAVASSSISASSSAAEADYTLSVWSEDLSGSLAERAQQNQKMKSAKMSHPIQILHASSSLEGRVLVVGPAGQVSLVDSELNLKASWSTSLSSSSSTARTSPALLKTFSFDRKLCTFVPSGFALGPGMVLVLLFSSAKSINLQALFVDGDSNGISLVGECTLPFAHDQISCISLSASGCLSILLKSQTWHACLLTSSPSSSSPSSLQVISLSPAINLSSSLEAPALLALTSTHVLLASPSPSSSNITLLLWDLQYGVLLAEASFPLKDKESFHLELVHGDAQQAVLVLSPSKSKSTSSGRQNTGGEAADSPAKRPLRSSVLVVPFSVPVQSTIAAAMGKGAAGKRWLTPSPAAAVSASGAKATTDPCQQEKATLVRMRNAMEKGNVQAADAAFFEWEKKTKERLEVASANEARAEGKNEEGKEEKEKGRLPVLGYAFVKDLLAIALPPAPQDKAPAPCSDAVVRYLLERKAVSSGMVEGGGLVRALRIRGEWNLTQLALETVLDIPEMELVFCLHAVLVAHQQQVKMSAETGEKDAMDVDPSPQTSSRPAPSTIFPLATFLAALVAYPSSTPALRQALRVHLKQPEDVTTVLSVLEGWVRRWNDRGMPLAAGQGDGETKDGKSRKRTGKKEESLPPLDQITKFIQTLLDASFVLLLSHTPAHKVLKHLSVMIEPEIALLEAGEQLRGPLEPFANAHNRASKEKEGRKKGIQEPLGDWRQRRRQQQAQAGLTIGEYQLEELVL